MSTFDPPQTTNEEPTSRGAVLFSKLKSVAKAYPYPAFVVAAFLALGVISFLVAAFRGPAAPAPASVPVTVPAAPVAAVAPAPAPAAGFSNAASPAAATAIPAMQVVLPPAHTLETPVERGSVMALSVETTGNWKSEDQSFVEVSTVPVPTDDSVSALTYSAAADLFGDLWPARSKQREVSVSGLIRVEKPDSYAVVLSVNHQGRCVAELGPRGNVIATAEAENRADAIAAANTPLEAGFYRVAISCRTSIWSSSTGGASIALRSAGGSPKVMELFQIIDSAEPAPVSSPDSSTPEA